jgi:hypothetical protein
MAGLADETLGALQQSLGLAQDLLALFELLLQAQEGAGIFEQPLSTLRARRQPARVQRLDLAAGQFLPHDLLGQLLAGLRCIAGQRHQGFHRRLHGNPPLADRLLDRRRKLTHQTQTSRHPAGALDEALGQLVLAPAEAVLKLGEQPPLLEGRGARAVGYLPLQDQRLGFLHLPHQRLHRVTAQPTQSRDSLMAVDDHVASGRLAVGDHHDRLLLAVLFQAQAQPTLLLDTHRAKRRVGHLQLVKFQLHDGCSHTPRPSGVKPQPGTTSVSFQRRRRRALRPTLGCCRAPHRQQRTSLGALWAGATSGKPPPTSSSASSPTVCTSRRAVGNPDASSFPRPRCEAERRSRYTACRAACLWRPPGLCWYRRPA